MPLGLAHHSDPLATLVDRCRATIPFYSAHLDGVTLDRVTPDSLPTMSKSDLRGRGPRPLAADGERVARFCATSGTTGARLLVGFSSHDWNRLAALLGRRGQSVGLGYGDLVANTHGYGLWIGGPALDLMARGAGAGLLPVGPGQTGQLVEWLAQLPITAMSATPSFLRLLADRIAHDGLDPTDWSLRIGLIGGEVASAELRRAAAVAFGDAFHWQELYGATEVGGPTLGWAPPDDPFGGQLLLDTDEFAVEVLQLDANEPAAVGQVGEITVSTPFREIDPLVRYRTRDLVRVIDADAATPLVTTIIGRVDDALKVRGALVYPGVIESVVSATCAAGAEWRVVVERTTAALDTLTVVVEHDDPASLADAISAQLGIAVLVVPVAAGSLDRFEGKARRVEDRR